MYKRQKVHTSIEGVSVLSLEEMVEKRNKIQCEIVVAAGGEKIIDFLKELQKIGIEACYAYY